MDKYISVEGVNLPNKPLTNFQLIDTIKRLKIPHFRGVFMRNDFIFYLADL